MKSINKTKFEITLDNGEVYIIDRYCPHEGADLSNGYVDEKGMIRCPWHHLMIDPKTGETPCKHLKNIKVKKYDKLSEK